MAEIKQKTIKLSSGETVTIRSAVPLDAVSMIDFVKAVLTDADWSVTQPHEIDTRVEKEIEWIEDHTDSPGRLALIAESGDDIVGLLHFTNGARERNRHVGIFGMSVQEDWRRRGIGQALLQSLLEWAKANPLISKVCLTAFSTNEPAIRLYRRMGFIEEGRQHMEYRLSGDRYVDGILMYQFTGDPE
jgi:RimJ/RimL family protein N-acetyltransferase